MTVEQTFGPAEVAAAQQLIALALHEDLADRGDLTTQLFVPADLQGSIRVVVRQSGVLAGSPVGRCVIQAVDPRVHWHSWLEDGACVQPGDVVAEVRGPMHSLLKAERTVLNFLTHLSGIATLTHRFVQAVQGTAAKILDTRKTLPGLRRLEKYAVRCGGGHNHRLGLYDGVLIKDNHWAAWATQQPSIEAHAANDSWTAAILQVRQSLPPGIPLEVEVESLQQLEYVLAAHPDIVLLDNMQLAELRAAVSLRNRVAPTVQLEASGGISLANVRAVAETGVERISIGALTHSAPALDLAFDWSDRD
ncbi:MAG: nicotinate-nucleotide diphosphorylase (carboxylating) [Planctomycetaceae bacterium]|nr:MAG: nicotinate-nucleotide diphosphorylase (carboxylating) [Planctomycetaceae bacterium]